MSELPSMQGRLHRDASECIFDVRFWHLADIRLSVRNVCFRGQSGHGDCQQERPLLTQSGHRDLPIKQKAPDHTGALNFLRSFQLDLFSTFALCPCAAASLVAATPTSMALSCQWTSRPPHHIRMVVSVNTKLPML
jgi:hypothetical protein